MYIRITRSPAYRDSIILRPFRACLVVLNVNRNGAYSGRYLDRGYHCNECFSSTVLLLDCMRTCVRSNNSLVATWHGGRFTWVLITHAPEVYPTADDLNPLWIFDFL